MALTLGSLLKPVGKLLGVTGKPKDWLPAALQLALTDPVAGKEAIEANVKAHVKADIATTKDALLAAIGKQLGGGPQSILIQNAVIYELAKLEGKIDKFQL